LGKLKLSGTSCLPQASLLTITLSVTCQYENLGKSQTS
jgi:hypothetical protein